MSQFRPLLRRFPRPANAAFAAAASSSSSSSSATKAPYLVSMMTAPSSAFNQVSSTTSSSTKIQQPQQSRHFTSSAIRASGDETHYEPPGGWLFGVPPGEKYKKEGWENVFVWGFWGSLAVAVVAYAYKPDTSIQTWALEEARRRLEAEGILPDPEAKN